MQSCSANLTKKVEITSIFDGKVPKTTSFLVLFGTFLVKMVHWSEGFIFHSHN